MTANVSPHPPTTVRPENLFLRIEREGREAYQAGLLPITCRYTGIERRAWLIGYESAARGSSTG